MPNNKRASTPYSSTCGCIMKMEK
uniref:Uncharacterized protein n=1 Tax=Arundo donax TaxID=35708 RepID=A0A0A9CGB9_ARUDO